MTDISNKVLVVDDKEINRLSAKMLETQWYTVETAPDFLTALKILSGKETDEKIHCYFEHPNTPRHGFLLTDLMFPFGGEKFEFVNIKDDSFSRAEEVPLGYALSIYAAKIGVPKIAIVTDTNHHAGPLAATFDLFADYVEGIRQSFRLRLQGSDFMLFDERGVGSVHPLKDGSFTRKTPKYVDYGTANTYDQNEIRERYLHQTERFHDGKDYLVPINAKNWARALELLLK